MPDSLKTQSKCFRLFHQIDEAHHFEYRTSGRLTLTFPVCTETAVDSKVVYREQLLKPSTSRQSDKMRLEKQNHLIWHQLFFRGSSIV